MIPTELAIDTNSFFAGGAGMFIQYQDVVKPIGLYVIIKMLITGESYGLPTYILKELTNHSLVEWYLNRRYINPLRCLDFRHKLDPEELDNLYQHILDEDPSIYQIAAPLNVMRMMDVYRHQHLNFPIYVYHPYKDPNIIQDCENILSGTNCKYAFGPLDVVLKKCGQNFTYIFSDIELLKSAAELSKGSCSHMLLTQEYRYNKDKNNQFRYNLLKLAKSNPFVRIGITLATNQLDLARALGTLYRQM